MKLDPTRFDQLRRAIAPSGCVIAEVEVYPGATHHSPHSVVACGFSAGDEAVIRQAAEEASRLVGSRVGIDTR